MIFIYAIALCLFVFNVKPNTLGDRLNFNNLTKDNTLAIRGICSILVIFHHFALLFDYGGIIANVFYYFGGVSVGFFFFLSAYGLRLQYQKYGGKYLRKILLVKIPKLYLYLLIVNIVFYFVFEYPLREDDLITGLLRILGLDWTRRPNQDAWYVYTLIVMYALFVCVFSLDRFIKNKNVTVIIMSLVPFLYIVVLELISKQIHYDSLWLYRRNIQLFSCGILYAAYKNKIDAKLRQFRQPICVALVFICTLGLQYYCEDVISVAVVLLAVILCAFVSVSNAATKLIGKASLQIYLVQRLFIRFFSSFMHVRYLFALAVLACSVASALLIYYLDTIIGRLHQQHRAARKQ